MTGNQLEVCTVQRGRPGTESAIEFEIEITSQSPIFVHRKCCRNSRLRQDATIAVVSGDAPNLNLGYALMAWCAAKWARLHGPQRIRSSAAHQGSPSGAATKKGRE